MFILVCGENDFQSEYFDLWQEDQRDEGKGILHKVKYVDSHAHWKPFGLKQLLTCFISSSTAILKELLS